MFQHQSSFNLTGPAPAFPSELLLEILQYVPFSPSSICQLSGIHPRIRALLKNYEHSITHEYSRRQLPHARIDFLCKCGKHDNEGAQVSYRWLSGCIRKYDVIDGIMDVLCSDMNIYKMEKCNMGVANTGLLLLYRLCAINSLSKKLAWIASLPLDPLTAMFLAIHYSIVTARYHGCGIIGHGSRLPRMLDFDQISFRTDIEFCFAEGAMELGPDFISEVLMHSNMADAKLLNIYHEHVYQDDWITDAAIETEPAEAIFRRPITQGPVQDPSKQSAALYTTLLQRMAQLIQCPFQEVEGRIVVDVRSGDHSLAWLDVNRKARLMQGLDLDYES